MMYKNVGCVDRTPIPHMLTLTSKRCLLHCCPRKSRHTTLAPSARKMTWVVSSPSVPGLSNKASVNNSWHQIVSISSSFSPALCRYAKPSSSSNSHLWPHTTQPSRKPQGASSTACSRMGRTLGTPRACLAKHLSLCPPSPCKAPPISLRCHEAQHPWKRKRPRSTQLPSAHGNPTS